MKSALSAIALCLAATLAPAQPGDELEQRVARGVADLSRARPRQLASGEWQREQLAIDSIAQSVAPPDAARGRPQGVVRARITVHRSATVPESMARLESLPMTSTAKRYEVELRFAPEPAHDQWVFVGGRYWILDDQGTRRLELTMFTDLLRDAPLDAPHELAWAITSP